MTEWKDINTAPRGEYITTKAGKAQKTVHKRQWVWTYRKDGHMTQSAYLPVEDRWIGYTKAEGPDMWHPNPIPPTAEKGHPND